MTPQTARNLLKHAVTTLLAHMGFENASDIAIETLIDVADHFLRRMTLLLKVATEQRDHGFPVKGIYKYYCVLILIMIVYITNLHV